MNSQIRQNILTGEWVIFSPSRRKRPMDFIQDSVPLDLPAYDPHCPFCPGNEAMLSEILYEHQHHQGQTWSSRLVYNKFPALTPEVHNQRDKNGIFIEGSGYGSHLVIIESPEHDLQFAEMQLSQIACVVETYHHCYQLLAEDPQVMLILLFKNYGRSAGASLYHPHSQAVASCVVPRYIRLREEQSQRYFDELGRCLMCDIIRSEAGDGSRMVFQNQSFAAFVPFASEVPCELWVVPIRHAADFNDINEQEKLDLAECLKTLTLTFKKRLQDPDYNFVIHSCTRFRSGEPQLHWFVRMVPRLTTRAGFEIGSGICINPSLPEIDAHFLRGDAPVVSSTDV